MLDTEHQPPARLLAQMRATTQAAKVPVWVADMMAETPDMSAARAETLKTGLEFIHGNAQFTKLTEPEQRAVMADFLKSAPAAGSDEAAVRMAAADALIVAQMAGAGAETREPRYSVGRDWDRGPDMRAKFSAALSEKIMPSRKPDPMAAAHRYMALSDIAMQVCQSQGLKPFDGAEAVRMAMHSTSDFPLILADSLGNVVARRMQQMPPAIVRASHPMDRPDYRQGNSLTLSATGVPQEVTEGGEIRFVTANEGGELLPRLRSFGSGFNISNQALVNDGTATGLLGDMAARMTEGATERLAQVLLEPIVANSYAGQNMRDGNPMFTTDRGNLAASGGTISVTTLSAARLALRKAKGLNGEHLAVEPWGLMVPPELETTAQQVLAELMATKVGDVNPFQNSLELIVEPRLAEAAGWYLLANPTGYDGLAHAFLNGQSAPRVETREGWETLGLEMRLTWALDAKFIQTATWYRNPGA